MVELQLNTKGPGFHEFIENGLDAFVQSMIQKGGLNQQNSAQFRQDFQRYIPNIASEISSQYPNEVPSEVLNQTVSRYGHQLYNQLYPRQEAPLSPMQRCHQTFGMGSMNCDRSSTIADEQLTWIAKEAAHLSQQLAYLYGEMQANLQLVTVNDRESFLPIITINHLIAHREDLLDMAQKIRMKILKAAVGDETSVVFEPVADLKVTTPTESKTEPAPTPEPGTTTFSKVSLKKKVESDSRVIHGRFQDSLSSTDSFTPAQTAAIVAEAAKKVEEMKKQKSVDTPKPPALDGESATNAMDAILAKCCGSDKSPKKPQRVVDDTDGGVVANINVKEAPKVKRPYKRRVMSATKQ